MINAEKQSLQVNPGREAVVFDFDGTIADSFDILVETIGEVLGRPPLNSSEVNHLRGLSIPEIEEYFQVKSWQKPGLLLRGRQEIAKKMNRVSIFPGMDDALKIISEHGHTIYILSSNSEKSIQEFLDKYKASPYVSAIHGGISIGGKAKHLKKLLRQEGLQADGAVYVGDEVRDIEATQRVGMKCISVAWGYSTRESLEKHHPSAIVSTPKELIQKF